LSGDRLPTGIEVFDGLIEGGIPRGSLVMLVGAAGSGKTVFASQYLFHGISSLNESGIYVSFAEDRATYLKNMKRMNMDFEKFEREGRFVFLDFATVTEKGTEEVLTSIMEEIGALKAKRLVIDSFSALAQAFERPIDSRVMLHTLLSKMVRQAGCTTLLVVEKAGEERLSLGAEKFVADGVIALSLLPEGWDLGRKVQVVKMRGTNTNTAKLRYRIDEHGMRVYPQPEIRVVEKSFTERVGTGIQGLDRILDGGLFKGSVAMIAGPSGSGKTTTALQFVHEAHKHNDRSLLVSFEEPVTQLIRQGEALGWDTSELIKGGALKIVSYYPELFKFEELLSEVRNLLDEYKPARFALDSLTPLERVLSEDECTMFIKSLQSYLRVHGMTALFTVVGETTALEPGTGISTLMDTIISLRYVEVESSLRRSLVVFKARGTAHDKDIREFDITSKGIVVMEKFVGLEQILGGAARKSFTEEAASAWARAFAKKR
jgi:circadian clock protein KaiC